MSSMKAGNLAALAVTLLIVIVIGSVSVMLIGGFGPFAKGPPGTCTYGGTWPNCNAPPPVTTTGGGVYAGSISFLITPIWKYSGAAANEGTNDPSYKLYHADKTLVGAMTITAHVPAATTLTESPADAGTMYLAYVPSSSAQTYYVDPAATVADNSLWLTGYTVNTDPTSSGTYDVVFTISTRSIQYNIGQTPTIQINFDMWKVDTGGSITSISNPSVVAATGSNSFSITGYLGFTAEGYIAQLGRAVVWMSHTNAANTTASSLSTLALAGTVYVTEVDLLGTGAVSGKVYGQQWKNVAGTYDSANTRYVIFTASNAGTQGLNQPAWAMPLIYERGSGASWLGWTIKMYAGASAFTASKVYYVYVEFLVENSIGATTSIGYKATITTT